MQDDAEKYVLLENNLIRWTRILSTPRTGISG